MIIRLYFLLLIITNMFQSRNNERGGAVRKFDGAKAIKETAQKNGISVTEVRREIKLAINAAMLNPDPAARAFWDKYILNGNKPTPEEFIVYVAKKINAVEKPQRITWSR